MLIILVWAGLTKPERDQLGTLLGKLLFTLEEPDASDRLEPELGLVVVRGSEPMRLQLAAPAARSRRRPAIAPLPTS